MEESREVLQVTPYVHHSRDPKFSEMHEIIVHIGLGFTFLFCLLDHDCGVCSRVQLRKCQFIKQWFPNRQLCTVAVQVSPWNGPELLTASTLPNQGVL